MHWSYERDETSLTLEACYDTDTAEYVAVLHHPDGREASQRFSTLVALRQCLLTLDVRLTADRWNAAGIVRHRGRGLDGYVAGDVRIMSCAPCPVTPSRLVTEGPCES